MSTEKAISGSEGRLASRKAMIWVLLTVAFAAGAIIFQPPWLYDWLKVLHIGAVISWMAGLFYLPRLFVYHSDCDPGSETARTFVVMEDRLLKVIMRPAMLVSWGAGLYLAWSGFGFTGYWLWLKIILVLGLSGFHGYLAGAAKKFARGENPGTSRQWRMLNEIPTILMIAAVILVVIKPFSA